MTPSEKLLFLAEGSPISTFTMLATALGITPVGLTFRLRQLPESEHPETFWAGNTKTILTSAGVEWLDRHVATWEGRKK